MNCKTLFQNLIAICKKSSGFASILPLLIIALAAISSSTPLLVENLLNGNPPGQKIASDDSQQIAGTPDADCTISSVSGRCVTCSSDSYCTKNYSKEGAILCAEGYCYNTLRSYGQSCGENKDCSSDACVHKKCALQKSLLFGTCDEDSDCVYGLQCGTGDVCIKRSKGVIEDTTAACKNQTGDNNSTCNTVSACTSQGKSYVKGDSGNLCGQIGGYCCVAPPASTPKSCEEMYDTNTKCMTNPQCEAQGGVSKFPGVQAGQPGQTGTCAAGGTQNVCCTLPASAQSCYSKHSSRESECKADTDCVWFPGLDSNGTSRTCFNKENAGLSCGTVGYCSKDNPFCIDETYCSNTPSQSTETDTKITISANVVTNGNTYTNALLGLTELSGTNLDKTSNNSYTATYPKPGEPKLKTGTYTIYAQALNGSVLPQQSYECTGGCTVTLSESNITGVTKTVTVSLGTSAPKKDNPAGGNPQQPVQNSEPISGTVNVVGSTASKVTVSVNGTTYDASKDSGIAWKYKTADLPAGSYTITAAATLVNSNGTLSGTTTANSGASAADITISAYTGNIISEKCGTKGVSENSISGFLYTACMASSPATLTEAEKGKFDQNKAALAKDKGNPYCGKSAFDVYECKDGSIETIAIGESEDTCNTFPWCPEKGETGLTTDPCAGPDNRPETCSCQPDSSSAANGKYTQDNCATDLYCAPGKNPQVPGYACCPKYEQFCPATNTCIGTNESCGSGVKTPDKLPDNQQSLGCPNTNSDGTQNVCSTISSSSSQPTDGIQSGNPGYNSSKNYTRNQNGDKACADNYASTKNANFKYCWKESGSASSGGGGGGGTGGQQPGGGGSAGFIGKACPSNPDKTSSSYLATECENKTDIYADDYYCTKDFKGATWACCQFGTRFCSLNNLCVSSENDCIAPTPIPNSGNGNTTQPGTAGGPGSSTNYCYNGQKDCTPGYLCSNPAGGSTAQCVVRTPEDPESNCAIAKGFECTDTYDATLNVDDALARDVCRSVGKKYCAKKAQPAQSGCPHALDTSGNKLSDSKSICQTSSTCPAGTKPGSSANNAACGTGQYCCIDTRYSGSTASTQSVASTPESTCKTSKDCVNSKSGNACVYFTSASTGICKTY